MIKRTLCWKIKWLCLFSLLLTLFAGHRLHTCAADTASLSCEQNALYSYESMEHDIHTLIIKYPSLLHGDSLGKTPDGRYLYHLVIGNENAEKQILLSASIHAREYITMPLLMRQTAALLQNLSDQTASYRGCSYQDLMKNIAIHIVPMINPDGVSISQFGMDGIRSATVRQEIYKIYELDQAVEKAVTECIDENILAEFLRKNRAEAIEVCIFEYDEKRETELIRKAEFAEGEKVGEAKILLNLIEKGILTKEQALEQFGGTYEELEKAALSVKLV